MHKKTAPTNQRNTKIQVSAFNLTAIGVGDEKGFEYNVWCDVHLPVDAPNFAQSV